MGETRLHREMDVLGEGELHLHGKELQGEGELLEKSELCGEGQ